MADRLDSEATLLSDAGPAGGDGPDAAAKGERSAGRRPGESATAPAQQDDAAAPQDEVDGPQDEDVVDNAPPGMTVSEAFRELPPPTMEPSVPQALPEVPEWQQRIIDVAAAAANAPAVVLNAHVWPAAGPAPPILLMPPEIADNIAAFAVGLPNIPDGELTADQRRILAVLLVLHGQGNPFRDFAIAHLWHTVAFPQPSFGRIVRALESSRFRDRYGAAVRRVNLRGGQDPSDLARGSQVQLHHRIVELLDRFAETVTGMRNLADLTVIGQLGRHFRAPVPVAQRIVERATRIRRGPFPAQQRVHLQGCATSSDSLAGLFASSSWNRLTSVVLGEDAVMGNVLTSGLISSIGRHVPDGLNGIEWLRRIDIRMHCLARPRFIQFFFSKCRRVADFAWVLPEASDGAVAGFEQKVAGNGHLRCLVLREPGGLTASEDRSAWLRMAAAGRQTLKVLELHKFDLSTGPTGAAFAQLLPQLHLEGLSLTECTLTPATSQAIAACTQLRAFRLSRPTGHGVRIRAILDALPRDLEHLDLELDSAAGVLQGVRRFAELRWARLRLDMGNGDGVEIADALASLQQLEEAEVAEAVADVVRGRLPRLRVGTVAWEP